MSLVGSGEAESRLFLRQESCAHAAHVWSRLQEMNGPLQYSCLENPMHRGVHGVSKESDMTEHIHTSGLSASVSFLHRSIKLDKVF